MNNITASPFNRLVRRLLKHLIRVTSLYVLVSIVVIFLGLITFRALKKRFLQQKGTEISSIAELKVQQISDFREKRSRDARLFYGNQSFIQTVESFVINRDSASIKKMDDWFAPMLKDNFYDAIAIINPKNLRSILVKTYDKYEFSDHIDSSDLKCMVTDSICFGDLILNQNNNTIHFSVFVPLLMKKGFSREKIAVLKFEINPYKRLYDLMQSMPNSGKTGEVLVVKKDGNDIVYLNDLRFKKNAALKLRLPITTKDLPATRALLGDERVREGTDYRGKKVLAVARLIPGTDWSVVVKFDTDEIYDEFETISFLVLGLVLLLLVAAGFGLTFAQGRKQLIHYKARIRDLTTIQRLSRVYRLLLNIEQAIVKHKNREQLLNEVCNLVVNDKDYILCWVGIINNNSGFMENTALCSIEEQYLENIEIAVSEKVNESSDPAIKLIITGKSFVSNNIWLDPLMKEWRERALSAKFKSLAVFPLIQNNKTTGAIYFYADKAGYFIAEEIKLLDRLSQDLSYALDKLEMDEKVEKAREKLLEKDNKLMLQNKELIDLNEKYIGVNDELKTLNERLERINLELDRARKSAEESNRLKSTFLANMSHEIRTPMNAVIGFAGLLDCGNIDSETSKEYCQIIIDRSNDLLQIINDILDISKIDSHTVILNIENISFNDFLYELHMIYLHKLAQVKKKHIKFIFNMPNEKFDISTDELKLRQIFTNLLDNAIKFTDSGEIKFGYHSHDEEKLICFVSDTGIGIDPKYQTTIFDIFTQAESTSKKNIGGTGLGLAICKGNALLLGGDIRIESEPGKGSTFLFSLKHNIGTIGSPRKRIQRTRSPVNKWEGKKLLLVEDDKYSIEYVKRLLSPTGIDLYTAKNGSELEQYYNKLRDFNLVLLDIRLPDANGFDLLKKMKALDNELPIIAQTAFAMEDDKTKCIDAGFDDYIAKPFTGEEIINLINSYLV